MSAQTNSASGKGSSPASTTRGTSRLSTTNTSQSPGRLCSISASAVPVSS